jgi:hypothetical protein
VYKKNAISYTQTLISQILDNEMAGQRSRLIPNGLKWSFQPLAFFAESIYLYTKLIFGDFR